MGRRLQRGSRLVIALGLIKSAGQRINYGSGKDVSDETIADAGDPVRVDWFTSSYVEIPLKPQQGARPLRQFVLFLFSAISAMFGAVNR